MQPNARSFACLMQGSGLTWAASEGLESNMHQLGVKYMLHVGVVHEAVILSLQVSQETNGSWSGIHYYQSVSTNAQPCWSPAMDNKVLEFIRCAPVRELMLLGRESILCVILQVKVVSWPRSSVITPNEWGPQAARAVSAAILHGNSKRRLG